MACLASSSTVACWLSAARTNRRGRLLGGQAGVAGMAASYLGADVTATTDIVPDSERRGVIGALPTRLRPYASLMRVDRPIGTWLLYWPCAWSVALAGVGNRWDLFAWLALGAFAMRSAGCVYNDIVDRDLDRQVERTRLRPLASGRVSLAGASALIALLLAI